MGAKGRTGRILVPLALLVFFTVAPAAESADRGLEDAVKATFLYKFASFVEWPAGSFESDTAPFELCVVGTDPYGGHIERAVAGQSVGRHPVVLRRLARVERTSRCHAAFLTGSSAQGIGEALEALDGAPILTITDSSISHHAGIVNFVMVDDRVRFDIDETAASRDHLSISSNLLALARRVSRARSGTR